MFLGYACIVKNRVLHWGYINKLKERSYMADNKANALKEANNKYQLIVGGSPEVDGGVIDITDAVKKYYGEHTPEGPPPAGAGSPRWSCPRWNRRARRAGPPPGRPRRPARP